ncbi:hypothetical protein [Clostridium sp. JS66]|uniref:hypothetical protein n=1 Tax=Clostridium sp. JS66 TaxID=3064705 RepID=UPI00298ECA16|nr:hypothetical protein [Clostridium sp. JS66]WPC39951.1 hypothetical protein Q6H37_18845 [Clostridium sp. JS66]
MSIQINTSNIQNNNITNSKKKENKQQSFSKVLDEKVDDYNEALNGKLDDEDKLQYKEFEKAGLDMIHHSLDYYRCGMASLGFPPPSAPSYVRKAWREMLEQMPLQQRKEFETGIIAVMGTIRYNNEQIDKDMEKTNFSYSNFADEMLDMADSINHGVGFDNSLVMKYLNIFKENLGTN